MPEQITRMQALQFAMMRHASFNSFDGHKVVDDLKAHTDLWDGVVMDVDCYTLRDMPSGDWHFDTLMVTVPREKVSSFLEMIEAWDVDECDKVTFDLDDKETWRFGAGERHGEHAIYRLWWD